MLRMFILTIPNDSSIIYGAWKKRVLFLPVHLSSFSPEFHEFWFFFRCTVLVALGSCFRLMSIMWTFNQSLKPCSPRWELVNDPKQWKQPGQLGWRDIDRPWPQVQLTELKWETAGSDVRNSWMWQIIMTEADRSYRQHHEEWLSFTGGSEGVMRETGKPPWKGPLGLCARPTAAWQPHQPQDIKLRLTVPVTVSGILTGLWMW